MSNVLQLSNMLPEGAPPIWTVPAYHLSVGRHSHDFFELVYIRDGFCLHDVDGKMTLLMEGDLFVIRPGTLHRYVGNRVVNLYNCMFTPDALDGRGQALMRTHEMDWLMTGEGEHCPRMHLELSERKAIIRQLTDMCEECASRRSGWDAKLTGQLASLLVDCMRMYAARVGAERDKAAYSGYVTQALRHIDANYAGELSVTKIAEVAGVSADYLTRQFRMVTGITPLEYLKRYRFARAMELLQSGLSVTEASERVGFQNLCHFSREFRKSLGITPSQYRNQNHEGGNESWH